MGRSAQIMGGNYRRVLISEVVKRPCAKVWEESKMAAPFSACNSLIG